MPSIASVTSFLLPLDFVLMYSPRLSSEVTVLKKLLTSSKVKTTKNQVTLSSFKFKWNLSNGYPVAYSVMRALSCFLSHGRLSSA